MNAKTLKIIHLIAKSLLTLLMLMSAGMYLFNTEMVRTFFTSLGYPTYLIYPLAAAKILGLVVIWIKGFERLKQWAYAGFFFDFVLAFFAHFMIKDGGHFTALIAIILVLVTVFSSKQKI